MRAFQDMRPVGVTMRGQLHAMLDRALIKLLKILKDTQDMHPWYAHTSHGAHTCGGREVEGEGSGVEKCLRFCNAKNRSLG